MLIKSGEKTGHPNQMLSSLHKLLLVLLGWDVRRGDAVENGQWPYVKASAMRNELINWVCLG